MQTTRIPVPADFGKVFSHFYHAANDSEESVQKTLLPSFQTILIFSFGNPVTFISKQNNVIKAGKALLLGPIKQPVDYTLPAGADILVANFKSGAFYGFFGQAMIAAENVHPDDLLGENCFDSLWNSLNKLSTTTERVDFILDFCKPYIRETDGTLNQIISSETDPAFNPIKKVAQETQLSERSIQLKHQKFLGYSAKEASRYQRFMKAIKLIEENILINKNTDWFEVIDLCGYYDQSQLIHDFKHYLNLSPTQYLKFQEDVCIAKPD